VDSQIANLRKKIEPVPSAPRFLKSVKGIGYRFDLVDGFLQRISPDWSPNGQKIYDTRNHILTEVDLSSGQQREVFRDPLLRYTQLSPDGKYVAASIDPDPSTKESKLLLIPVRGGEPHELFRMMQPEAFPTNRSEDLCLDSGRQRAARSEGDSPMHAELWEVYVNGGPARKLEIDPNISRRGSLGAWEVGMSLSPTAGSLHFLWASAAMRFGRSRISFQATG
jgi:hypothetical protein